MSHYEVLYRFLRDDVVSTLKDIKVISYSVVSMIIIGAAGIWIPWLWNDSKTAFLPGGTVFTYVLALLGSLVCNKLFFHSKKLENLIDNKGEKDKKAIESELFEYEKSTILSAWGILAGSLIIVLTAIVYSKNNNEDSLLGFIALIFSWILYYMASVTEVREKTAPVTKGNQEAEPIIPVVPEENADFGADFFQNGEG
ncbi:MAG: hypothetical protein MK188_14205 [Gammaproteobacteria bacterium]|nr:hypothetical protein [Gammaproteobacteria bacterium]